jgi:hypothetical protein
VARCWVVEQGLVSAGSCSGELVKAHLVPQQRIKRQFPRGAQMTWRETSVGHAVWVPVPRSREVDEDMQTLQLADILWDRRVWVPDLWRVDGQRGASRPARRRPA